MNTEDERTALRDVEAGDVEGPPGPGGSAGGDVACTSCGSRIPEGARSCPVCHRGVYRTCYCGWQLPASEQYCPNCGADWSQSMRVARKSRSRTPKPSKMMRYAAAGALAALLAGVFAYIIVNGLALVAVEEGGTLPAGVGARLSLAALGAAELALRLVAVLSRYVAVAIAVVVLLAVGAVAGVAAYLTRLRMLSRRPRRKSRSVRRKRRNK